MSSARRDRHRVLGRGPGPDAARCGACTTLRPNALFTFSAVSIGPRHCRSRRPVGREPRRAWPCSAACRWRRTNGNSDGLRPPRICRKRPRGSALTAANRRDRSIYATTCRRSCRPVLPTTLPPSNHSDLPSVRETAPSATRRSAPRSRGSRTPRRRRPVSPKGSSDHVPSRGRRQARRRSGPAWRAFPVKLLIEALDVNRPRPLAA